MNSYELCILFSGNHTTEEIDAFAKEVDALLSQIQANVKFTHSLGRRKLAYKIKGNTHGEYRCWLFEAEGGTMPTLNQKLRLAQFVVRHMIVSLVPEALTERITKIKEGTAYRTVEREHGTEREDRGTTIKPAPKKETYTPKAQPAAGDEEHKTHTKKLRLDDLDEKLDEILESDKI